jgi:hypothetical protein
MKKILSIALAATTVAATSATSAVIYSESFDYGGTTADLSGIPTSAWNDGTGTIQYDHDGGLSTATVTNTGGAMFRTTSSTFTTVDSTPNFSYTTLGAGNEMWLSYLVDFTSGETNPFALTLDGGSVSSLGIDFSTTAAVTVRATLDGTVNKANDTGLTLGNGVSHILLRATKGTGTSPVNSQLDLWINPSSVGSVGALGAASWTLDSGDGEVKWGRDGNTFSSIIAAPSAGGRLDEIRIATSFSELSLVPEPSTALLGALGFLALLRRRR